MMTDAQWNDWLASDSDRVLLVEVNSYNYSQAKEITHYFSTREFNRRSEISDENIHYAPDITDEPFYERRLAGMIGGQSFRSFGDISIRNIDGEYDQHLGDSWEGRDIVFLLGSPDWDYTDFRVIHRGIVKQLDVADKSSFTIVPGDLLDLLDAKFPLNEYTGEDNEGVLKPLCFGLCENVTGVLIDEDYDDSGTVDNIETRKYQIHDGKINSIRYSFSEGRILNFTSPSSRVLDDDGVVTITHPHKKDGINFLDANVCFDALGAMDGDEWPSSAGEIILYILKKYTDIRPNQIDYTSFNSLPSYLCGYFTNSEESIMSVIMKMIPDGWYLGVGRDGRLQAGLWSEPTGEPVLRITEDEIEYDQISIEFDGPPSQSVTLKYRPNFTVQDPKSFQRESHRVGSFRRKYVAQKYYWRKTKINDDLVEIQKDPHKTTYESYLQATADVEVELDRLNNLLSKQRYWLNITTFTGPYSVNLGDVVEVTHPRFGLENGQLFRVAGITEYLTKNKVKLKLWR